MGNDSCQETMGWGRKILYHSVLTTTGHLWYSSRDEPYLTNTRSGVQEALNVLIIPDVRAKSMSYDLRVVLTRRWR